VGRAGRRTLTALEFQGLAAVPLEVEWFANIDNPRTRRAYRIDIREFVGFVGIGRPEGVPEGDPGTRARLAERLGGAGAQWANHPAQARGALLDL